MSVEKGGDISECFVRKSDGVAPEIAVWNAEKIFQTQGGSKTSKGNLKEPR